MDSIPLYEKREELERVLHSRYFTKAKMKCRFLEFVCEQTFLGNADKLNEYLVGMDIYERGKDFDPKEDPIVRVQAHEIRRLLKRYYEEEGKCCSVRIDLPSGHYVPTFTRVKQEPARDLSVEPTVDRGSFVRRYGLLLALTSACVVLALLFIRERLQVLSLSPKPALSTSLPENMVWFWGPFLPPAPPPLIVMPNHPLLRAVHDGDSSATLAQSHMIPKEKLPQFRDTMHFRELKGFFFAASTTDFTAVGEALGLVNFLELFTTANQKVRVKVSRLVDFEEIKKGNTILLGGNQPWSGRVFLYQEGFWFQRGVIVNKHPRPGEQAIYKPTFDPVTNNLIRDYALVLMLPNEKKEERILLIYGVYTQGSQAAIEYVTNAERLQELQKALMELRPDRSYLPKYFQILLETPVENFVPGPARLLSARIIPE